ncbi:MAG TPA: hypothetical protein PKM25_19630 [Candidatus Ozemobacteraceae bacterium]|nr:hypothetical protein [Candidatus Ozemobacteraceae bacterium]
MTEFEALGRYTHYREMAEAHATGMLTGLDGLKDLIRQTERDLDNFNVDRALALLLVVKQSCGYLMDFIEKENTAAQICGRQPISRSIA